MAEGSSAREDPPARFGRQNRLFEQNAIEGEKTQDWLAERIGFELVVAFRRTIALYWPTKCVVRRSAANRESKPENRVDCTVHNRCRAPASVASRQITGTRWFGPAFFGSKFRPSPGIPIPAANNCLAIIGPMIATAAFNAYPGEGQR